MQDSGEKTIPVGGESREEMIREREEREDGGDWEPNSEDIDSFDDVHNDVTPWGSTSHCSQGTEHKNLTQKRHGSPSKQVTLNPI